MLSSDMSWFTFVDNPSSPFGGEYTVGIREELGGYFCV